LLFDQIGSQVLGGCQKGERRKGSSFLFLGVLVSFSALLLGSNWFLELRGNGAIDFDYWQILKVVTLVAIFALIEGYGFLRTAILFRHG
tara:strand:+ start:200 stop:466 length:267 start_codon:yes stop_codon:yes gene_type:complete